MNQFSDLLQKAAAEVRHYCATSPNAREFGEDRLLLLAHDMEAASALTNDADVERAIDAILYWITDWGPLTEKFAPSFDQAADALYRRRKRADKRANRQ
jgi:hypothetical protein